MARRRKTSPIEDLLDLVAMLPWWCGVLLSVLSYIILHSLASKPLELSGLPAQASDMMFKSLTHALAGAGQYFLPGIFLCGAGMSAWRRSKRQALVKEVTSSSSADALNQMSWQDFELLVGEAFRLQGFSVLDTGGGGPDGGMDLRLQRGGDRFLVQCKQWRAYSVGVGVVRELYGVMAASGVTGGFVVCSGKFTQEAQAFAAGRSIKLIDGPRLHGLIKQAQESKGKAKDNSLNPPRPRDQISESIRPYSQPSENPHPVKNPGCPKCQAVMAKRTAQRGPNAGQSFWGCSAFPSCRGTLPIG